MLSLQRSTPQAGQSCCVKIRKVADNTLPRTRHSTGGRVLQAVAAIEQPGFVGSIVMSQIGTGGNTCEGIGVVETDSACCAGSSYQRLFFWDRTAHTKAIPRSSFRVGRGRQGHHSVVRQDDY